MKEDSELIGTVKFALALVGVVLWIAAGLAQPPAVEAPTVPPALTTLSNEERLTGELSLTRQALIQQQLQSLQAALERERADFAALQSAHVVKLGGKLGDRINYSTGTLIVTPPQKGTP